MTSASDRAGENPAAERMAGAVDGSRTQVKLEAPRYAVEDQVWVDGATTTLLVIDMQNDFVKRGGSLPVPDAEATVPAIRRLLDLARARQMRIVYSQDTHLPGDREWRIWPQHCLQGSWGWEIVAELAPDAADTVLCKVRHDAFFGTPLTTCCDSGALER